MTYYIYHIPGKKIGVTRDLKYRVEEQQGYGPDEYDIIMKSDNIEYVSEQEIYLQKMYGYRVDETPYNELKFNNTNMNINITEATTTFPCPVNKLKGRLMDNIGMTWETDHGRFTINKHSIGWIMKNIQTSRYNEQRSYVYNKAFARFYDNHVTHDMLGGNLEDVHMRDKVQTLTGGLSPTGPRSMDLEKGIEHDYAGAVEQFFNLNRNKKCKENCDCVTQFDLIRDWASERGLYTKGDPKTQTLKLMEEAGEICRAVLKNNRDEIIDGIGDCVVVLTNLAELIDMSIEDCIEVAYAEISNRTGKMVNGTFKKD